MSDSVLRYADVCRIMRLSRQTIWRMVNSGEFPKPFPIRSGGRTVGWMQSDVEAYLTQQREGGTQAANA